MSEGFERIDGAGADDGIEAHGLPGRSFSAMGCRIELALDTTDLDAATVALDAAESFVHDLAATLTRFDDGSELRRLGAAGTMRCSPELVALLRLALEAREQTGGRFDPTLGAQMVAAGYDRTFAELPPAPDVPDIQQTAAASATKAVGTVDIDDDDTVTLGPGVELDLGGIAKGWIADRTCALLAGTAPALVSAGGDVACTPRASGEPWAIAVEGLDGLVLDIDAGGIATSGTRDRRWLGPDGLPRHHVLDPATGESLRNDLVAVTVVAEDCAQAEVLATALLVAGLRDAFAEAQELDLPAVLVLDSGEVVRTGPLA